MIEKHWAAKLLWPLLQQLNEFITLRRIAVAVVAEVTLKIMSVYGAVGGTKSKEMSRLATIRIVA